MWNSMRGRFVTTAVALLMGFSAIAVYASAMVQTNREDSRGLIAGYYRIHRHLEDAKETLRQVESSAIWRRRAAARTGRPWPMRWHRCRASARTWPTTR